MLATLVLAAVLPAHAAPIKATWTANGSDAAHDAANVGDGKVQKVWVEGDAGAGLGSWVLGTLAAPTTVTGMTLWTGAWTDADAHDHYGRPKILTVEFSDGATEDITLADGYQAQTVRFKSPRSTSSVKLKVKAVHAGKGPDTAISEVVLLDAAPATAVAVASATASSMYSPSYDPFNAVDGAADAIWCEGNAGGDGTGEWIEFSFAAPTQVSKLAARVGVAYNFPYFMKSNRPTTATLAFSDGSTENITFDPKKPSEQVIAFVSRTTSKVRVTFTGVTKGTEFNDLCLADVNFQP